MSETPYAKCACQHCANHIEFPLEAAGMSVDCPHCGQPTRLESLSGSPEDVGAPVAPATLSEALAAFAARVRPAPTSLFYQLGLLLVSLGMVLLPLVYLAMIALAAYGVYYYATHFSYLLKAGWGGPRGAILRIMLYVGPLFIGVVLVLFMVKPLFARRGRRAQPLALNPGAEPLLFACIAKVCEAVGAPMPVRIDLDCQLNASASFRRGFSSLLGNDLVLTVGLPLVAGLNQREFAGVVAHEFGHFTQGLGMRLSYVIRSVNGWFARVVYERDAWDEGLADWAADSEDWRVSLVLGAAQLAVGFSRFLLMLVMLLGHGISCFLLRQMEYDADSYEIKLAGSAAFESATRRLHVLSKALERSYANLEAAWAKNRQLPDNFPAVLLRQDEQLPATLRTKLEDTLGLSRTGLFDTHPSAGDRIRRARQANTPGIFPLDGPATDLFGDFDVVARQVTVLHYRDDLGIPVVSGLLVP